MTATTASVIPTKTPVMMNDYEKRFEYSLKKLSIPSWYSDAGSASKLSNKQLVISSNYINKDSNRTPEIVHVNRPRSYRSCRSSAGTSPSPSVHSWHPNHLTDGTNFSTSAHSRHAKRYEKGIERVAKASHWYQPAQFVPDKKKSDRSSKLNMIVIKINLCCY